MSELNEELFRRMLAEKGLTLDENAFASALQGARHLKTEVARLKQYLKPHPDKA